MRISPRTRTALAALAATTLTMTVPAAPLVSAQPSEEPNYEDQIANPTPPPPDPGRYPVTDDGQPDQSYVRDGQQVSCVVSLDSPADLTDEPWAQDVLRINEAHKYATGFGQTVAVIDTGVNAHQYFQDRLDQATVDYVNGEQKTEMGGANPPDCDGHGTQVAGIIAANPNRSDIGFKGIAYNARILSIRQSSSLYKIEVEGKDPETAGNLKTLAKAIMHAANNGATVINMSVDACRLASRGGEITPEEGMVQTALQYAVETKNVVPVVSAGNTPNNCSKEQNSADPDHPSYIVAPPWFSDLVLSVAAVQRDGETAQFSVHGPWVSVAAPGTEITSLDPARSDKLVNQTSEGSEQKAAAIQGTSFAAPYVAGLAALVRQRFPDLSAKQVMQRIEATAAHPAGEGGRDLEVGFGMIDPVAALTEVVPGENGIASDKSIKLPSDVPPPYEHNWAPMQVAMIGSGGGLSLLLLTLFIVHTIRRNRREEKPTGRHAA